MVSTGHHLATLAGLEVLRQGGNAVDAAVAGGAVACVVLPHACGLGGDAFAIGYDASSGEVWTLNASGKAPQLASAKLFPRGIPEDEVAAATVPGIVHGWSELLNRYGTKKFGELLGAAIAYAEEGFMVDECLSRVAAENHSKLRKYSKSRKLFFGNGRPVRPGQYLRQPDLARTLKRLATRGPDEFYAGETARAICRHIKENGGLLRLRDMNDHRCRWADAIGTTYGGYEVYVTPPNSIAVLLLVQLRALADTALRQFPHNSAAYIDTLVRAKRVAFEEVLPLLGDPDTNPVDIRRILSSSFIRALRRKHKTRVRVKHSDVSDTTCVVTVDGKGNAVSLIQSIYFYFGCGVIAGNTGVILNNRMLGFSLAPCNPNLLMGGKRPAHTLSPALVLRKNRPFLAIGTPGAYAQTQTLCQVLNNILIFDYEVQQAIELPRWFHDANDDLLIEERVPRDVTKALARRGYKVRSGSPWEPKTGGVQAVLVKTEGDRKVLYGAADPRRHGSALGW